MLAPARIPVAAGKKTAKTVKKFSLVELPTVGRKSGTKLSDIVCTAPGREGGREGGEGGREVREGGRIIIITFRKSCDCHVTTHGCSQ